MTIYATQTPTLGGTFLTGFYRILGTCVGGLLSIVAWEISPAEPIGLTILSTLILAIFTHIRFNTRYPKLGVVSSLTYLVVLFGKYLSLGSPNALTIYQYAYTRVLTIMLGVLIVFIVGRLFWPYYARVEARHNISKIIHDFGVVYGNIVVAFVKAAPFRSDINSLLSNLQLQIIKTKQLLEDSKSEPRLQGPFPYTTYARFEFVKQKEQNNIIFRKAFCKYASMP